jgi:hypothetical protein
VKREYPPLDTIADPRCVAANEAGGSAYMTMVLLQTILVATVIYEIARGMRLRTRLALLEYEVESLRKQQWVTAQDVRDLSVLGGRLNDEVRALQRLTVR